MLGAFDCTESSGRLRIVRFASLVFSLTEEGRHSDCSFSQLNGPAASTSVYVSTEALADNSARLEAKMESLLLILWSSCIPYNVPF